MDECNCDSPVRVIFENEAAYIAFLLSKNTIEHRQLWHRLYAIRQEELWWERFLNYCNTGK